MGRFRFISIQFIFGLLFCGSCTVGASHDDEDCSVVLSIMDGVNSKKSDMAARIRERQRIAEEKHEAEVHALKALNIRLPRALQDDLNQKPFFKILDRVLQSKQGPISDLVANVVTGSVGSGKSTLVNRMVQTKTSGTSFDQDHEVAETGFAMPTTQRTQIVMSQGVADLGETPLVMDAQARFTVSETQDTHGAFFTFRRELNENENLAFVDLATLLVLRNDQREPEQRAQRIEALRTADVLFILCAESNVLNLSLREAMLDLFASHGPRHVVFIMRVSRDDGKVRDWARQKFTQIADVIYGAPPRGFSSPPFDERRVNADEGVLGMYLMPSKSKVERKHAHAELRPLDGYPDFDELISSISRQSFDIRAFNAKATGRIVHAEIKQPIREIFRKHYQVQIYGQIVKAALELPPATVNFPFDKISKLLLRLFAQQRNQVLRVITAIEGSLVHTLRLMPGLKKADSDLRTLALEFDAQLKKSWLNRIEQIKTELDQGNIVVSKDRAGEIDSMIKHYSSIFPEDPIGEWLHVELRTGSTDEGLASVRIRNLEIFGSPEQKEVDDLVRQQLDLAIDHLENLEPGYGSIRIDEEMLRAGISAYLAGQYKNGLRQNRVAASGLTMVPPVLGKIGGQFAANIATKACIGVAGLVGGCAVSSAFYYRWEARLLRDLNMNLNAWISDLQLSAYDHFVGQIITHPLDSRLNGTIGQDQAESIDQVRRALEILGVETQLDFPLELHRRSQHH